MNQKLLLLIVTFCIQIFVKGYNYQQNIDEDRIFLLNQDLKDELQELIENFRIWQKTPGVALSVNIPNIVNLQIAVGYSQYGFLREKIQINPEDKFRIASISKTFTSAAILKLFEENKLDLQDSISKWLPSSLNIPNQDQITIFQLLHMISGIADFVDYLILPSAIDPSQIYTPFELIKIAAGVSPEFSPGEKFKYSNTNFVILGAIVEVVAEESLQTYITKNFIEQFGLKDTFFPSAGTKAMPEPYCRGYIHLFLDFFVDETYFEPSQTFGCGSMVSTVADLTKWAQYLYTGQVLNEKGMSALFDYILTNSTDLGIYKQGAGVELFNVNCGAEQIIGHAGQITGYNSMLAFNIEEEISIAIFQNSFDFNQRVVPAAGDVFCIIKKLLQKYNFIQ